MKKLILALIFFLTPAALFADEIQMVSGEILSGRILARDEHAVYLQASGFIRNLNLEEIISINSHAVNEEAAVPKAASEAPAQPAPPALPYPLLAFAYQALGQPQLTFDMHSSKIDLQDAQALRSLFILTDRSLASFVNTLLWRQSGGREGRSDALLFAQIKKIENRMHVLDVPAGLESLRGHLAGGVDALAKAFEFSQGTSQNSEIFESNILRASNHFRQALYLLSTSFPAETERNRKAWSCHIGALLSVERGLKS